MKNTLRWSAVWALALSLAAHAAPNAPSADEFAWRGSLALPQGSSLARVELPVEALLRMQSATGSDVRVFNADGAVVPFALLRLADTARSAPAVQTRSYQAYALYGGEAGAPPVRGAVEVRVGADGGSGSAWVHWGATGANQGTVSLPAEAQRLQAVLFDTRSEQHTLAALQLQADLPRNTLVHVRLERSTNLKDWEPLVVKGPVFRFDGADAPSNLLLELPLNANLRDHYLRMSWAGQEGVRIDGFTGRVAGISAPAERVRANLAAGNVDGMGLVWNLPFATPLAGLHVQAAQDNTLVPVRISGRSDAAQPWRAVASTVVYRLDTVGQGSSNPVLPLAGTSLRALRVEPSNGQPLPAGGLKVSVEFAPVQLALLASGPAPFTLAVGRANTVAASVDVGVLQAVTSTRLVDLPAAAVKQLRADSPDAPQLWAAALLPDGVSPRVALLWLVLLGGVVLLGAVAYGLLRQLTGPKSPGQ